MYILGQPFPFSCNLLLVGHKTIQRSVNQHAPQHKGKKEIHVEEQGIPRPHEREACVCEFVPGSVLWRPEGEVADPVLLDVHECP